jgi:hypothetical protein
MAALVQSYPQQSSTITMLQTRPASASGILQTSSQAPSHHQYAVNPSQMQRNSFHGINNSMVSTYRGHTSIAPIAPYAFTSTPDLMPGQRAQSGPHLRPDQRTSSAPVVPNFESGNVGNRSRYPAAASISTTSSSSSSDLSTLSQKTGSRDDSALPMNTRASAGNPRPQSTIIASAATLSPPAVPSGAKSSPDRYRRPNNRRAESSTTGSSNSQASAVASAMPNVMQFYGTSTAQQSSPPVNPHQGFSLQMPQFSKQSVGYFSTPGVAADDMQVNRHMTQEQGKRYRRRSIHTIEAAEYLHDGVSPSSAGLQQQGSRQVSSANGRIDHQQHPLRSSPIAGLRPGSSHGQNDSSESVNSTRSSQHSRPTSVSCPAKHVFPPNASRITPILPPPPPPKTNQLTPSGLQSR